MLSGKPLRPDQIKNKNNLRLNFNIISKMPKSSNLEAVILFTSALLAHKYTHVTNLYLLLFKTGMEMFKGKLSEFVMQELNGNTIMLSQVFPFFFTGAVMGSEGGNIHAYIHTYSSRKKLKQGFHIKHL